MKFSEHWLRSWVDPPLTTAQLAEQLTMAGLEVDAIEPAAPDFSGVVVGVVLSVEAHPQADRLRVCRVDAGQGGPLTIVCGAANVHPGMRAPLALAGAMLPGGVAIAKGRLRGVESEGMLCSAKELGLAETAAGLLALPDDARPGADIRDLLDLADCSFELGLTPNRGDCLSVAGIAREVGVLNGRPVAPPPLEAVPAASAERFAVEVAAPEACPRYVGRVIRGIDPAAETPLWMRERLRRSGLRSLGPVVDVTNYVLLELGQPMHAFDLERLRGGILVRHAEAGELLTLLDGQRIAVAAGTLVIADHAGPVALAGVMGGQESAVGTETRALFLESAFFTPEALAGQARRYGLHTDSSHRFERGVDPGLARRAMERATRLLLDICGGEPGPVIEAATEALLPHRTPIVLRAARLRRVLGVEFTAAEVEDTLERLGTRVVPEGEGRWQVTAPAWRFDLAIEADLIEEIARIHGYERLPGSRPAVRPEIAARAADRTRRARELLAGRGYQEAITYSFVDAQRQHLIEPGVEAIVLANPISSDSAAMRTSLWPGLLAALVHNQNRQQRRVRLFECGAKYQRQGGAIAERRVVAGVASGSAYPEQWGTVERAVDFYDVKGDVAALLGGIGGAGECGFVSDTHPALHPGQSAALRRADGGHCGWLGRLHPEVARGLGVAQDCVLFELEIDALPPPRAPMFRELSKFPAIRRDLAIIVDERVPAQAIQDCIRESGGELLHEVHLFDVYRGKGVTQGSKSVALGLTLQDFSRTLTDQETDALIAKIVDRLREVFGAVLRDK